MMTDQTTNQAADRRTEDASDMIECDECAGFGMIECDQCGTPEAMECDFCGGSGEVEAP